MDYFNGKVYQGGRIINEFDAPYWKLPVFVKRGAIIPMVNPNNNVSQIDNSNRIFELYPYGESDYSLYDDDGKTELYRIGEHATTHIPSSLVKDRLTVNIDKTEGNFAGQEKNQSTEIRINVSQAPKKLVAKMGGKTVKLTEVSTMGGSPLHRERLVPRQGSTVQPLCHQRQRLRESGHPEPDGMHPSGKNRRDCQCHRASHGRLPVRQQRCPAQISRCTERPSS